VHRSWLIVVALSCLGLQASQPATADEYPSKSITMIVPFTPGGGTDIMARLIAKNLSESLGKPVLVENKPGAGGIVGTDLAAHAAPDGYTLMLGSVSTISINPSLYKNLTTDPLTELSPVAPFASTPSLLVVPLDLPVSSVQELIAYAKKQPEGVNFASAGSGTSHHLSGELFKSQAGIKATHIPYKGSAPALLGVIRGDAQFMIANVPSLTAAIEGRQVKAIAITSLERSPELPQYKTVAESGLPGFEVIIWYGVFAPAKTPAAIINRLNAAITSIATLPEVRKVLRAEGAVPMTSSPEEFAARIQSDYRKWKTVVDASGAKAD
jgi:tripartite-type tricarboxylate transporter receptor subunit TctC